MESDVIEVGQKKIRAATAPITGDERKVLDLKDLHFKLIHTLKHAVEALKQERIRRASLDEERSSLDSKIASLKELHLKLAEENKQLLHAAEQQEQLFKRHRSHLAKVFKRALSKLKKTKKALEKSEEAAASLSLQNEALNQEVQLLEHKFKLQASHFQQELHEFINQQNGAKAELCELKHLLELKLKAERELAMQSEFLKREQQTAAKVLEAVKWQAEVNERIWEAEKLGLSTQCERYSKEADDLRILFKSISEEKALLSSAKDSLFASSEQLKEELDFQQAQLIALLSQKQILEEDYGALCSSFNRLKEEIEKKESFWVIQQKEQKFKSIRTYKKALLKIQKLQTALNEASSLCADLKKCQGEAELENIQLRSLITERQNEDKLRTIELLELHQVLEERSQRTILLERELKEALDAKEQREATLHQLQADFERNSLETSAAAEQALLVKDEAYAKMMKDYNQASSQTNEELARLQEQCASLESQLVKSRQQLEEQMRDSEVKKEQLLNQFHLHHQAFLEKEEQLMSAKSQLDQAQAALRINEKQALDDQRQLAEKKQTFSELEEQLKKQAVCLAEQNGQIDQLQEQVKVVQLKEESFQKDAEEKMQMLQQQAKVWQERYHASQEQLQLNQQQLLEFEKLKMEHQQMQDYINQIRPSCTSDGKIALKATAELPKLSISSPFKQHEQGIPLDLFSMPDHVVRQPNRQLF